MRDGIGRLTIELFPKHAVSEFYILRSCKASEVDVRSKMRLSRNQDRRCWFCSSLARWAVGRRCLPNQPPGTRNSVIARFGCECGERDVLYRNSEKLCGMDSTADWTFIGRVN